MVQINGVQISGQHYIVTRFGTLAQDTIGYDAILDVYVSYKVTDYGAAYDALHFDVGDVDKVAVRTTGLTEIHIS